MQEIHLPRVPLGFFPTPVEELPNLSKALGGPRLFMKRDDLTGLAFGGNKTRKLEFILAEAVAQGCDCVVTAGAEQSNHCRQTAAAAAKLNRPTLAPASTTSACSGKPSPSNQRRRRKHCW